MEIGTEKEEPNFDALKGGECVRHLYEVGLHLSIAHPVHRVSPDGGIVIMRGPYHIMVK